MVKLAQYNHEPADFGVEDVCCGTLEAWMHPALHCCCSTLPGRPRGWLVNGAS